MINPPIVVAVDRFHIRVVNVAFLSQFDVVVVVDGANQFPESTSPGDFEQVELDAFRHYYWNGSPLVLLCGGWGGTSGARQSFTGQLLDNSNGLGLDITIGGDAWRGDGGKIIRKTGSSFRIDSGVKQDDASFDWSPNYYTLRFHIRKLYGSTGGTGAGFVCDSPYAAGDTHVVSAAANTIAGTWTYLITYDPMASDQTDGTGENVRHMVFEPSVQTSTSIGYEGVLPGRVVLDGDLGNFSTADNTNDGEAETDQVRMLAEAIVWANRERRPGSVLIYNTQSRRWNQKGNDFTLLGDMKGVAGIVQGYLGMPLESMGGQT